MIKVKQFIIEQLYQALSDVAESEMQIGLHDELIKISWTLEHPAEEGYGDLATNMAMVLFGKWQNLAHATGKISKLPFKDPRELAAALAKQLTAQRKNNQQWRELIAEVSVAGSGFINLKLSANFLLSELALVLKEQDKYGINHLSDGQKVCVEYTDPNPFKEFHIGHLYTNIVGESIANLQEARGATVWRADFFGDVGMHVAKSIWGLLQKLDEDQLALDDLAQRPLDDRIAYLGQAYALGAQAYRQDNDKQASENQTSSASQQMRELNFLIYKAAQEVILPQFNQKPYVDYDRFVDDSNFEFNKVKALYVAGREWSLEYFETIYRRLGTSFDGYYPESVTGEIGYQMVMDGLKQGFFEKGEGGAIIYPGKKQGLHDRVFINSQGLPTYEAKDLGLAVAKFADFAYDKSYNVTGNEINEYFKVVLAALNKLKPKLAEVTAHLGHGMVKLSEGKMSSRTGKVVRGTALLDQVKEAVLAVTKGDAKDGIKGDAADAVATEVVAANTAAKIDAKIDATAAEIIAQGAVKYAFLKHRLGDDLTFDLEASINLEGDSGPYLQYTHVRCRSVLRKAGWLSEQDQWLPESAELVDTIKSLRISSRWSSAPDEWAAAEWSLLRYLYRYPEVVERASQESSPHIVCGYLRELAQRYNRFYNNHQILKSKDQQLQLRLALTAGVGQVLKNGLSLLGIKVPDKM